MIGDFASTIASTRSARLHGAHRHSDATSSAWQALRGAIVARETPESL
ncbi:MAG: hypothetical protein KDI66_12925 [Xanthomonadales bacterium]|nr:hypothetical protein [Xanthomonadales bacterium]